MHSISILLSAYWAYSIVTCQMLGKHSHVLVGPKEILRKNSGQWDGSLVEAWSSCHGSPNEGNESCPKGVMSFEGQVGIKKSWGKQAFSGTDSM